MVLKLFKDRIRNNAKKNVKSTVSTTPVLGVKLIGQKQRMKSLKKIYADLNKKTRPGTTIWRPTAGIYADLNKKNRTTIWRPTVRRRTPEIPSKVGNTPDPRLARKRKKELNKKAIKRQIANNRKMAAKMQGSVRRSSLRSRK